MCRYAMSGPYKQHYACFACCKAYKQPPIEDFLAVRGLGYVYKQLRHVWANRNVLELREAELGHRLSDLEEEFRSAIHCCPECGQQMADMGFDFKAPKQSDAKFWRTLQGMYRVGHAFHTCGCNGPGWIPKSTADYHQYLERQKRSYTDQLRNVQNSTDLSTAAKADAAEYWASRIEAIERELTSVS